MPVIRRIKVIEAALVLGAVGYLLIRTLQEAALPAHFV